MDKSTLAQSVSEFSKKLSRLNESEKPVFSRIPTTEEKLQNRINEEEFLRRERIVRQYNAFSNPVSQQIEDDEQNLVDAYNLFIAANLLNQNVSDKRTKLAAIKIESPVCTKSEYISGSGFSFLKIWFLKTQKDAQFVPEIIQENEKRFIDFVPVEDYKFSRLEKEILQETDSLSESSGD